MTFEEDFKKSEGFRLELEAFIECKSISDLVRLMNKSKVKRYYENDVKKMLNSSLGKKPYSKFSKKFIDGARMILEGTTKESKVLVFCYLRFFKYKMNIWVESCPENNPARGGFEAIEGVTKTTKPNKKKLWNSLMSLKNDKDFKDKVLAERKQARISKKVEWVKNLVKDKKQGFILDQDKYKGCTGKLIEAIKKVDGFDLKKASVDDMKNLLDSLPPALGKPYFKGDVNTLRKNLIICLDDLLIPSFPKECNFAATYTSLGMFEDDLKDYCERIKKQYENTDVKKEISEVVQYVTKNFDNVKTEFNNLGKEIDKNLIVKEIVELTLKPWADSAANINKEVGEFLKLKVDEMGSWDEKNENLFHLTRDKINKLQDYLKKLEISNSSLIYIQKKGIKIETGDDSRVSPLATAVIALGVNAPNSIEGLLKSKSVTLSKNVCDWFVTKLGAKLAEAVVAELKIKKLNVPTQISNAVKQYENS